MRFAPALLLLAACGSSPQEGPRAVPVLAPTGLVRHEAPPQPVLEPDPVLVFAVDGEVDDRPGADRVSLTLDGVLTAADATTRLDLKDTSVSWASGSQVRVVHLGGERRGVLVGLPTPDTEDPPHRYRIYLYERGSLRLVFDKVIGSYGLTPLLFEGDGIAYYEEDGWSACDRKDYPKSVQQERVRLGFDDRTEELVEIGRRPTGKVIHCDQLAACPFVYVVGAEGPSFMGEILRNVRGVDAYTTQTLSLGKVAPGKLTIRLAEEKAEVTYLDAVSLDVKGASIASDACSANPEHDLCEADGSPYILREGDGLELTFDVPGDPSSPPVEVALRATGYYTPTPTRARPASP